MKLRTNAARMRDLRFKPPPGLHVNHIRTKHTHARARNRLAVPTAGERSKQILCKYRNGATFTAVRSRSFRRRAIAQQMRHTVDSVNFQVLVQHRISITSVSRFPRSLKTMPICVRTLHVYTVEINTIGKGNN
ncbi:hypothetical protein EVAR_40749_1 [Eumeta japonica]|uniref:Uncharacterized protein n=1 Tax=Eumeta variegata TaxID=151549 RepID=A0A4C1X521_EUMVA|nr:hypothetical protein EVAR_40749_1 [Eumeta japonica]